MQRFRTKNRYRPRFSHDLAELIHPLSQLLTCLLSGNVEIEPLRWSGTLKSPISRRNSPPAVLMQESFGKLSCPWKTDFPLLPTSMIFNDIVITNKSRMASLLKHHFVTATKAFTTSDPDTTLSDTQPSPYWFFLQSYLSQRYRMNSPGWTQTNLLAVTDLTACS